jgi:MFS family permease
VRRRGPLAAFFVLGVFWGGWAALAPAIQVAVGATKGEFGLTLLFIAVGSLPAMFVAGFVFDRRGPRILPWLIGAFGASVVLPGFAHSTTALAAALFVVGAASGALDVAMNGAVSELEVRRGTRLMQFAHGLFSAGVLAGALGVGLARQAGADPPEILGGIAVVILAAGALNLRHEHVARLPTQKKRGPRLSRAAIPLGIACAAALVIEGGMENWGAIFLERDLDASPAVSALAPAAYGGAMMLGRFWGQSLERRLGDALLLGSGIAVAFAGLVGAALAPNVPVAVASFFVGGAGISIAAPTLFGAGGRNAEPQERGAAVATVTTLGYLGFLVGPPVLGGIAEALGLRASFAALALVAVALVVAIPRLGLEGRVPGTDPGTRPE